MSKGHRVKLKKLPLPKMEQFQLNKASNVSELTLLKCLNPWDLMIVKN